MKPLAKGGALLATSCQENGLQATDRQGSADTKFQKRFIGFLPGAHFLDNHETVTNFLLQEVSVGYNETKHKRKFITGLD
jgi:hypothetical protein